MATPTLRSDVLPTSSKNRMYTFPLCVIVCVCKHFSETRYIFHSRPPSQSLERLPPCEDENLNSGAAPYFKISVATYGPIGYQNTSGTAGKLGKHS
jgi:hypothetical protein